MVQQWLILIALSDIRGKLAVVYTVHSQAIAKGHIIIRSVWNHLMITHLTITMMICPTTFASITFSDYKKSLAYLIESHNLTEYKLCWLKTGIVKPGIFLGLQENHTLNIPQCFGYDIMHLVLLNLPDLLISLWHGTITGDKNDWPLWDWAVLKGDVWMQHGQDVTSMRPYLPGLFDQPPWNPVKKINSSYKAWEFLMYIFVLGPSFFYNILPKK